MANMCIRPTCDNERNTGAKYCSPKCSALDRKRVKAERGFQEGSVPRHAAYAPMNMPIGVSQKIRAALGDQAEVVLDEVNVMLQEAAISIPLPIMGRTEGDWFISLDGKDLRPGTNLSFDIIERMLRSGPVMFAMEMKRAQVVRVFGEGRYKAVSPDRELAEIADASLRLMMAKMADDLTYAMFAYGVSLQEEVWGWKTKYELGLSKSRGSQTQFLVPNLPNSVKPSSVTEIRRTEAKKFNGFVQKTQSLSEPIVVSRQQSLVVPMGEHFRNLWGKSFLHTLYPIWLWYEIVFRAMVRYMERMATPVAKVSAPSRGLVEVEGKTASIKALDMALSLAGSVAKSNAIAIPSDMDENSNPLWTIEYLTAAERSQPFIAVLEFLVQELLRAALSADRSLTQQSGGVGSQNIGEVHARASAMTSEMILLQILHYLNLYFMPGFSLYNRGVNGPPIWLKTQAIDLIERETLMKLMNIAGNTPVSQEIMLAINWRGLAETSNIPLLDEAEVEKLRKKLEEESLAKLKKQNEMMATLRKPGESGNDNEPPGDNKNGSEEGDEKELESQLIIDAIVADSVKIPWILGPGEATVLHKAGCMSDEIYGLFGSYDKF